MPPKAPAKERGSEVLRRLSGNPKPIDLKHLESVFRLIDTIDQAKILDWRPKGTPQFFEALSASAEIRFDGIGKFVEGLCRDDKLIWNCKVFPKGIPWPEIAIVEFNSEQVR
jgi:hypothetical protein